MPAEPPGSEPQPEPEVPPAANATPTQPSARLRPRRKSRSTSFDAANVTALADHLAAAAETLIALQTQVQGIAQQFEQTRQELREQKEQLALAAAKADQDRARIRSVAASMADDMARLEQTKADLAERLSGLVQDECKRWTCVPADGGGIIRQEDDKRDRSWTATTNRRGAGRRHIDGWRRDRCRLTHRPQAPTGFDRTES